MLPITNLTFVARLPEVSADVNVPLVAPIKSFCLYTWTNLVSEPLDKVELSTPESWSEEETYPLRFAVVDPVALEAKMIIDASGHDSVAVKRLVDRQLVEWKGMDPMWVEDGEEHVVHKTGEIYPGLVAAGMSVTETHGLARMGPTFGSMLYSGKRAAEVTDQKIKEFENQIPK